MCTRDGAAERCDATQRNAMARPWLCGQAERVLDCRSPLCPTHPPTALDRNTPLSRPRDPHAMRAGRSMMGWPPGERGTKPARRSTLAILNEASAPREQLHTRLHNADLLIPFLPLEGLLARGSLYAFSRGTLGPSPHSWSPNRETVVLCEDLNGLMNARSRERNAAKARKNYSLVNNYVVQSAVVMSFAKLH